MNVTDPLEDGSEEHPFDKIQEGIDAAAIWRFARLPPALT